MDSKVAIRKIEIPNEKIRSMSIAELFPFLRKKLLANGFNLDRKINRYENLEKLTVVYTQRKLVVPKRKKV